jgi:Tol biopolymer transport system component
LVGSELRKAPLEGGDPITLDASIRPLPGRPAWLGDGTIVYPSDLGTLKRVDGAGGPPVTILDDSTVAILSVGALPDARGVLFLQCPLTECPENASVMALTLPDGNRKALLADATTIDPLVPPVPLYAPSGHLVFGRLDGTVMAARFDLDRLEVPGSPVPVLQGVGNPGAITLAGNGTFAYIAGGGGGARRLVILDRRGSAMLVPGPPRVYGFPRFDPGGDRLAVEIHDESGGHLWLTDLASGTVSRITGQGHTPGGVWAPDGTRVAYATARGEGAGVFIAPVDRSETERNVHRTSAEGTPQASAWAPDGRWILLQASDAHGSPGVFVVDADGREPLRPLLVTPAAEGAARFSPDGRWLVYSSTESGQREIYVTAFPEPAGRWIISTGGGSQPVWREDEIFYRSQDGLYAATVDVGEDVRVVDRRRLFDDTGYRGLGATFDVSPDGRRFVMVEPADQRAELVVALNWLDELERLMPSPGRRP